MKGSIAITEIEVKHNKMGWSVFDFFKASLERFTTSNRAGWYAYKLIDGIYYFLWCDEDHTPSEKYLKALKKDGYNIGITSQCISDYFNSI